MNFLKLSDPSEKWYYRVKNTHGLIFFLSQGLVVTKLTFFVFSLPVIFTLQSEPGQ